MMNDFISRAKAIEKIKSSKEEPQEFFTQFNKGLDVAIRKIKALPSVEPKGEWIYDQHNDEHYCSECGKKALCDNIHDDELTMEVLMEVLSDYCPSCGAKMRGDVI